jgi:hypothetical protein
MKNLIIVFFLLVSFSAFGQLQKSSGVLYFNNKANLDSWGAPATYGGELAVTLDTHLAYRWNGSIWVEINTDDQTATEVNIDDSGGYYTGTDVESALAEIADTLTQHRTDIDTGGGGGGVSFPGVNIETLTGDKTLTTSDDQYQILDPGASSRVVTLPSSPDTGTWFHIQSSLSYTGYQQIQVKNSSSQQIDALYSGSRNTYFWDGTYWHGLIYPIDYSLVSSEENNVSLGYGSNSYGSGSSLGRSANSNTSGVAVGYLASGSNYGVGIGKQSNGATKGVAVGYLSNGPINGVAVGYSAKAIEGIAIGYKAADNASVARDYIMIGSDIDLQSATTGDEGSIGNVIFFDGGAFGTGTSAGTNDVGIGLVPSGTYKLEVSDNTKIDGTCTITSTIWLNSGETLGVFTGSGTPEGSVTADVGSSYHRTDGGSGTSFYVKESGTGNTGWVAK